MARRPAPNERRDDMTIMVNVSLVILLLVILIALVTHLPMVP